MSREIRCTVTDEEYADISAYVAKKKRWHKIGHFIRDACFQMIDRNPANRRGAVLHGGKGGDSDVENGS